MAFEKWDKFIEDNKSNMLFFEIYYNLTCYDSFYIYKLDDEKKKKLIYFIRDAFIKDETFIDIGHICDVALQNASDILNDKIDIWELLNRC